MKELSHLRALKAVIKYELKWDLRKLKIYISLSIVTALALLVTIYMGSMVHVQNKGNYWLFSLTFLSSSIFLFLMGAPVTMNSISGEFESGTIVPLLSRPVSRTEVFFGKVIASMIIILMEMALLGIILSVVSTLIMGPQSNLYRLFIYTLTLTASTMVYASFTMMLSSITKNSMASILGAFGVMFGIMIGVSIYEITYSPQVWFITLPFIGTDGLTNNAIYAFNNPDAKYAMALNVHSNSTVLSNITNLQAALISFAFTLIYIALFLIIGWLVFKRSDIKD
ncbi:MAG: ABC transporter permease [Thermoplasmata archaeon]|jgi:ABC-2 type transport system permease protein|nr:ABC transporter permease subunit [Thermoplasmatales archaeon]